MTSRKIKTFVSFLSFFCAPTAQKKQMEAALKKIEAFRAKHDALKTAHAQLIRENADLAKQVRALQKIVDRGGGGIKRAKPSAATESPIVD